MSKINLNLPSISLGCSPLGNVFGEINQSEAYSLINNAIEAGVNYFDTSPYYGLTKSEEVLGKILKNIPRNKYILSTKVGRYGFKDFNFTPEYITKEFENSLKRLNVDYVDILFAHDIEYGNIDYIIEITIPALRNLQKNGKCRYIGITGYPLESLDYIINRTEIDYCMSYCHYNLQNNMLTNKIDDWIKKGINVINASPLAMGLLRNGGPPEWHPATNQIKEKCKETATYCQNKGKNLSKLALQYALNNQNISSTLVGMSSLKELEQNLKWANESIDSTLLKEVQEILEPIHKMEWRY